MMPRVYSVTTKDYKPLPAMQVDFQAVDALQASQHWSFQLQLGALGMIYQIVLFAAGPNDVGTGLANMLAYGAGGVTAGFNTLFPTEVELAAYGSPSVAVVPIGIPRTSLEDGSCYFRWKYDGAGRFDVFVIEKATARILYTVWEKFVPDGTDPASYLPYTMNAEVVGFGGGGGVTFTQGKAKITYSMSDTIDPQDSEAPYFGAVSGKKIHWQIGTGESSNFWENLSDWQTSSCEMTVELTKFDYPVQSPAPPPLNNMTFTPVGPAQVTGTLVSVSFKNGYSQPLDAVLFAIAYNSRNQIVDFKTLEQLTQPGAIIGGGFDYGFGPSGSYRINFFIVTKSGDAVSPAVNAQLTI